MCYNLNKTRLSRAGSYIDSPKRLKNKEGTINPKNNNEKCFQYAITVALNHEQIKSHPVNYQRKIPLLINIIGKR